MKWQRCLHTDATRSRSTAEVSAGPRCSSRGGGTDCGTAQGRCHARCHSVTLHEALRSDAGSLARRRTCLQKVRSRVPDASEVSEAGRSHARRSAVTAGYVVEASEVVDCRHTKRARFRPKPFNFHASGREHVPQHDTDRRGTSRRSTWPHTGKPRAAAAQENMKSRTSPISADW
jgi:hypothetical protein